VIYKQLVVSKRLSDVSKELAEGWSQGGELLLIFCVLLMFANWGAEALKWKLLIDKLTPIRGIRSFKAVWTGITLGLFTPNRIGEFGGRLLYIPMKHRISGVVSSLIGSFSQILITFGIGIIALVFYSNSVLAVNGPALNAYIFIGILLLLILVIVYYNLGLTITLMKNRKLFKRIIPYVSVLDRYHFMDYNRVLGLSLFRFAIFTAQYLILLEVFGVHLNIGEGVMVIGVIFLAQTVLPSFTVAELFTRGNISLYFLGNYSDNSGGILAASTGLWLLNLIIPAVLGYFFILRKNFFKKRKYE